MLLRKLTFPEKNFLLVNGAEHFSFIFKIILRNLNLIPWSLPVWNLFYLVSETHYAAGSQTQLAKVQYKVLTFKGIYFLVHSKDFKTEVI